MCLCLSVLRWGTLLIHIVSRWRHYHSVNMCKIEPKNWSSGMPTECMAWLLQPLARKSKVASLISDKTSQYFFCAVAIVEVKASRIESMGRGEEKNYNPLVTLPHQKSDFFRMQGQGYNRKSFCKDFLLHPRAQCLAMKKIRNLIKVEKVTCLKEHIFWVKPLTFMTVTID